MLCLSIIRSIAPCLIEYLAYFYPKFLGIFRVFPFFSTLTMTGISIFQVAVAVASLNGPICGLFILAYFVPKANKISAFISFVVSIIFVQWIFLGKIFTEPYKGYRLQPAPLLVSMWQETTWQDMHYGNEEIFYLCRVSPFYTFIGVLVLVRTPLSYIY